MKRTTKMVYDVAGRVKQSTDPSGQTSTFAYNNLGQPMSASFPATTGASGETITYGYGTNGRTESVTDNRGTTSMTYESGGDRVSKVTDPVTGSISYTYGLGGERNTVTLPNGEVTTYNYAYMSPTWPQSGYPGATTLPKDDPNSVMPALYNITDGSGRKVSISYVVDNGVGVIGSLRWNQVYDNAGSLKSYCQTQYTYLSPYSSLTQFWLQKLGTTFTNTTNNTTQTLNQNDYTYNDAGQRLSNQITDNLGNQRTELYNYDQQNRLKTVDYGDGQTQSYAFDALGNRLTKTDSATGSEAYGYNAANMLLTRNGQNYNNDVNGNTITGGGRTNTWDSQNRMVQCVYNGTTSNFTYGADGLRHKMLVTNSDGSQTQTQYIYDGQNLVADITQNRLNSGAAWSNPQTNTYLAGASGPMYRKPGGSADVRWYVADGLGSVVGEVDVNGTMTSSTKRDVYGLTRSGSGSATSRQGFVGQSCGHMTDPETGGLVYMRARYYDAGVGRFASEDPKRDGVNWYGYCDDNPVCASDFSGLATLQETVTTAAIAAGVGGAGGEGAIEAGQYLAQELGECVAVHELEIAQWLEGSPEFLERRGSDIVDFTFKVVRNGIEITSEEGSISRTVFIDIRNLYQETAGHIQGMHIDFQHEGWSPDECWEPIKLYLERLLG